MDARHPVGFESFERRRDWRRFWLRKRTVRAKSLQSYVLPAAMPEPSA
jgi:hypothetical protein